MQYDIRNVFPYLMFSRKIHPHIPAYHLGPYQFLTNKHFVIEVRIEVEFSDSSQKAFRKMKQFWKRLWMENSVLLKGLKRPNTKSSKVASLSRMFFQNLHGQPYDMVRLTSCVWSLG